MSKYQYAAELKTVLDVLTTENVRMICLRVRVETYMHNEKYFEQRYDWGIEQLAKIDEQMSLITYDFERACKYMQPD